MNKLTLALLAATFALALTSCADKGAIPRPNLAELTDSSFWYTPPTIDTTDTTGTTTCERIPQQADVRGFTTNIICIFDGASPSNSGVGFNVSTYIGSAVGDRQQDVVVGIAEDSTSAASKSFLQVTLSGVNGYAVFGPGLVAGKSYWIYGEYERSGSPLFTAGQAETAPANETKRNFNLILN